LRLLIQRQKNAFLLSKQRKSKVAPTFCYTYEDVLYRVLDLGMKKF